MKKHAFIISNPGEKGADNYCGGVLVDVENIKNFLLSPIGGFWHEDEISCISPPMKSFLDYALSTKEGYDYLLIFFSGHGYHDGDNTMLELSDGRMISESKLRGYAKKQLIILDCCRQVYPDVIVEGKMERIIKTGGLKLDPLNCRRFYEQKIDECNNKLTVCYSCQVGEVSRDNSRKGGFYISSLLSSAKEKEWTYKIDLKQKNGVFSINSIHQEAELLVQEKTSFEQNPEIDREKSTTDFPFAVLA